MSKKMIAIMKKEFARFFGDRRLVFTTILMPGLMIYILYTLLGQGIMKQFAASEDYVYQIYTVDLPESFSYLKTESDLEVTEISAETESDVLEKIEAEEADLLMVFPSDFDAATIRCVRFLMIMNLLWQISLISMRKMEKNMMPQRKKILPHSFFPCCCQCF